MKFILFYFIKATLLIIYLHLWLFFIFFIKVTCVDIYHDHILSKKKTIMIIFQEQYFSNRPCYYLRLHLAIYSLRIRRIFCFCWRNPPNMLFIVITDAPNKLVIFGGYSRSLLFGSSHYNHCDKLLSCNRFVLSTNHLSNESKLWRN